MKKLNKSSYLPLILLVLISCGGGGSSSSQEEIMTMPPSNSMSPTVNTWPDVSWQVVESALAGMDKSKLDQALDYAFKEDRNTQAVVIVRYGVIVAERYGEGSNYLSKATSWSSGKSVSSALIGIAINKAYIDSVDEKVCKYVSEWDCNEVVCLALDCPKSRSEISIRDILEMRSGLEDEGIGGAGIYTSADDQLFFALNRQATKTSGTEFLYSNSDSMILSGILETSTGMTAREFAERELFPKIEMTADWWSDKAGHTMTYCCIDATTRDFARFGLLFARNGKWKEEQIISEKWVNESTSLAQGVDNYGLHWWIFPENNLIGALGLHTNDIWVYKDLDLVIVRNSKYTRFGTESVRSGQNIQVTQAPESWDNIEFLGYIVDSITN